MKFRYLVTSLLLGLFILSSCNKDEEESTFQFDKYPRIKSMQYNNPGISYFVNYEYDSKGRQIKFIFDDGAYTKTEYFGYTIKHIYFNSQNEPQNTSLFLLNTNGLVETSDFGVTYEYDENGYNIGLIIDSFSSWKMSIISGNRSYARRILSADTTFYNYEYFPLINTIGDENTGVSYFGKQNVNLTSKNIIYHIPELPDTAYFSYEFDSKDRVVKQIINNSGIIETSLYTYY
jgi:hypothetical protein